MEKFFFGFIVIAMFSCNSDSNISKSIPDSADQITVNDEFVLENLLTLASEADVILKFGKRMIRQQF